MFVNGKVSKIQKLHLPILLDLPYILVYILRIAPLSTILKTVVNTETKLIWRLKVLMFLRCRYQPDGALERQPESHLNMLKGGSSTLKTVFHPPSSPSEHSSSLVNISICVLGKEATQTTPLGCKRGCEN